MNLTAIQHTRIPGERSADFPSAWHPLGSVTGMKPATIQSTIMKPILYSLALLAGACLLPGCASSRPPKVASNPDEARAYFEVLRSDFNAGKIQQDKGILSGGGFEDSVLKRRGDGDAEGLRFQPPNQLVRYASSWAHHEHDRRGTTAF